MESKCMRDVTISRSDSVGGRRRKRSSCWPGGGLKGGQACILLVLFSRCRLYLPDVTVVSRCPLRNRGVSARVSTANLIRAGMCFCLCLQIIPGPAY